MTAPLTLREYLGEVVEELFTLDGKLPTTLRQLLFHPGSLSVAWSQGRRTEFVTPLRVYLLAAAVFFLVSELVPRGTSVSFEGQLRLYLLTVSVPVLALLLRGVLEFRKPVPSAVPYVVFALHAHAFVLLLLAVADIPAVFGLPVHGFVQGLIGVLVTALLVVYFTASLRTWRDSSWGRAISTTLLIAGLWYFIAVGSALLVAITLGDVNIATG